MYVQCYVHELVNIVNANLYLCVIVVYVQLIASELATLQRTQEDGVAKTEQYKRKLLELGHRVLKVHSVASNTTVQNVLRFTNVT